MNKWIAVLLLCLVPFSSLALEVTEEEFDAWYEEITYLVEEIGIRRIDLPGEDEACAYLRSEFERCGFSAEDGTLLEIRSITPDEGIECTSLIAIKPAVQPDAPIITVSAHYDSLSPGARDNASGVAAVMYLMRKMAQLEPFENTELRFALFSGEEYYNPNMENSHLGSLDYCSSLTESEVRRSLAAFNIDILMVDIWEDLALSLDTVGMRTETGYEAGSVDAPAYSRPALAMLQAMDELGCYPEEDRDWYWCGPRHMGMSDHDSFHGIGVDSVNICFRGPDELGGLWPEFMHTPTDVMGDFDLERSWNALSAVYTALDGLARDHTYGDAMKP